MTEDRKPQPASRSRVRDFMRGVSQFGVIVMMVLLIKTVAAEAYLRALRLDAAEPAGRRLSSGLEISLWLQPLFAPLAARAGVVRTAAWPVAEPWRRCRVPPAA
jgi:hypothetical protein